MIHYSFVHWENAIEEVFVVALEERAGEGLIKSLIGRTFLTPVTICDRGMLPCEMLLGSFSNRSVLCNIITLIVHVIRFYRSNAQHNRPACDL